MCGEIVYKDAGRAPQLGEVKCTVYEFYLKKRKRVAARNNTKENSKCDKSERCLQRANTAVTIDRHTVLKLRKAERSTEGVWPKSPVRISPATVYKLMLILLSEC